jgi:hypothetical protein
MDPQGFIEIRQKCIKGSISEPNVAAGPHESWMIVEGVSCARRATDAALRSTILGDRWGQVGPGLVARSKAT